MSHQPAPGMDEVHVWTASGGQTGDLLTSLALLCGSERARAERFRFERDRVRYARRHAFTRRVLASYLGVQPAAVGLRASALGKPELDPPCDISFNTSHSDDVTVVAVANGRRVGVDVERVRPIDDAIVVAEGIFTELEVDFLRSVSPASRSHAFLTLWTRKESIVKAVGGGLTIPLDGFAVLPEHADGAGRPWRPGGHLPFVFAPLDGPLDYVGAVTVAGSRISVRHMGSEVAARCRPRPARISGVQRHRPVMPKAEA